MGRIRGRRYADGQKYCIVCDKECSPYIICSKKCGDLLRKYGRKRAKEIIQEAK